MSVSVGKAALNYPSVLNVRVRSLSCCRVPRDDQRSATSGHLVQRNSLCQSNFSTANQESTRSERGISRSVIREWMQYLVQRSNLDLQSVSRVLAPLHIDLPKLIPQYKTGWGFFARAHNPEAKKAEEKPKNINMVKVAADETKSVDSSVDPPDVAISKIQPPSDIQKAIKSCEREQHDFAGAMLNTHESIGKFYFEEKKDQPPAEKTPQKDPTELSVSVIGRDPTPPVSQSLVSQATVTATTAFDAAFSTVKQIANYLPSYGASTKKPDGELAKVVKPEKSIMKQDTSAGKVTVPVKKAFVARGMIERRTRALVVSLREAKTPMSQSVRLDELCKHLLQYPETQTVAVKDKLVPCLLQIRCSRNTVLRESAMEALSLVGFIDPVKRQGIRVLTLDGGGTRGLIAIEIMKKLEEITQQHIHELFDYVCGVSTGSLIGIMASTFRVPLNDIEQVYKEFSSQMFARNKLVGAGKLFMSHAYYDTDLWETILKQNIGDKTFLETTRDPLCPKISAVSTLMNVSRVQNFLFRNYNLPPGRQSHYAGSIGHHLWEAIRASSAAPGYYKEFHLCDHVHQDGGLLTNNPTAIAIHECQLLWPNEALQCVVSIGTGRHEMIEGLESVSKSSLKAMATKVIQSATDTEAVHTVLRDLLRPSTYFRFNPYMSEDFVLDEIREAKWDQMKQDTEMYCRKNRLQLEMAAQRLLQPRPSYKKVSDWLRLQMAAKGR